MSFTLHHFGRLLPPSLRRVARRWVRPPLYRGDFATWEQALSASRGYADRAITEKVIAATRLVRDGRVAWERDTVLFQEHVANEPILRSLRHAADFNGGTLNLVDFGGALGSTWWQHRPWLQDFSSVRWSVVEQPDLVAAGRGEFTVGPLTFYSSLQECCAIEHPEVMLLSSVLPYLEDPHALLEEIGQRPFRHLIIDRTGFVERGRDRLTVQRVPASIYPGSYPCWFLDYASTMTRLQRTWRIVEEWTTNDEVDIRASHRGMLLERIAL